MQAFIRLTAIVLLGSCVSAPIGAQALGTDLFVAGSGGELFRMAAGQPRRSVGTFTVNKYLNMITMDADNYHVIALDIAVNASPANRLVRIDPVIGEITTTIWSGPPLTRQVSWIEVDQDGDYIVSHAGSAAAANQILKVNRDGLGITTLYSGMPGTYFNAFATDRSTGNYVVVEHSKKQVLTIDPISGTVLASANLGVSPYGIVQDPAQSTMYLATSGRNFLSFEPSTGTLTTVAPIPFSSNCITVDRAPRANGALIYMSLNSQVQGLTRSGVVTQSVGASTYLTFGLAFDRGRNVSATLLNAPNDRLVRISFPRAAGKPYLFALSLSGFAPGIPIGGGRAIPLEPDPIFNATANGSLWPVLTGNAGFLNAAGDGFARFNANALGGGVQGLRLWGAALTLEPSAPSGIGEISAPMLFTL